MPHPVAVPAPLAKTMLGLLLAVAACACGQARADAIDDFVDAQMQHQHIPGVAVAIIRHGEPYRVQGYGLANLEHHVPVHPDTLFQSGSIGKQFTSMLVMLLVQDGKIDLDTSVRHYLPDAPPAWQDIKVRNLLNHTGGLGDAKLDLHAEYSEQDLLNLYYATPLKFSAGRRWEYSNEGYVTLGVIIHKVSGRFYGDLLAERVFAPLGMHTARIISDRDVIPNRSAGYDYVDGAFKNQDWVSASLNTTADGALYLSPLDYVQWENALRQRALLTAQSWQQVLRPAPLADGSTYPYGFGWGLTSTADGRKVWQHGGAWQGFRTYIRRYDQDGITFVVLANASNAVTRVLVQGIAERYDARYRLPPAQPASDDAPALGKTLATIVRKAGGDAATPEAGLSPQQWTSTLADIREAVDQAGGGCDATALALYRSSRNGDRIEKVYRTPCAQGALQLGVALAGTSTIANITAHRIETVDESLPL